MAVNVIYKCSMGFQQLAIGSIPPSGWTETWYVMSDNPAAVIAKAKAYIDARLALSNSSVRSVKFRLSIFPSGTLAFTTRYVGAAGPFATPDTPWNAVWCTVATATGGIRRHFLMRGMTDEMISNGAWVPVTAWTTAFTTFQGLIQGVGGWKILGVDRTNLVMHVLSVNTAGIATVPAGTVLPTVGKQVKFTRTYYASGQSGLVRGLWTVTAAAGTSFTLANWPADTTVLRGRARQYEVALTDVSDIQVAGVRVHKVGRPLDLLHGRSSTRS